MQCFYVDVVIQIKSNCKSKRIGLFEESNSRLRSSAPQRFKQKRQEQSHSQTKAGSLCRRGVVMCPPKAGFVPKYSQMLNHFRHGLGLLATSEEELPQLPKVWNGLFGTFDLLEILREGGVW